MTKTVEPIAHARSRLGRRLAATLARMSPKRITPYDEMTEKCQIEGADSGLAPVGAGEIAEWFGVTRNTVDQWRLATPKDPDRWFPNPTWVAGGRPVWAVRVIEEWGVRTGRLSR